MFSLEANIVLILSYTDQFDWPLNASELEKRLILNSKFQILNSKQISNFKIKKALINLLELNLLSKNNDLYCLKGSEKSFKIRKTREKYAEKKWQEVREFVQLVEKVPGVVGLFVTGSLAMNATKKNDDVDYLIITRKNTLWLLRPLIILLAILKGKARLHGTHAENTWCLNMWLSEDMLEMPKFSRNIYTAYELCQAVCVLDKNKIEQKFLQQNNWVKNYLPNYYKLKLSFQPFEAKPRRRWNLEKIVFWIPAFAGMTVLSILNTLAFALQRSYMSLHMSQEKVDLQRAFFHPRDTRGIITKNWQESLLKLC